MVILAQEGQLPDKWQSYQFFLKYVSSSEHCDYDRFLYIWRNMLRICHPEDMDYYWDQYDNDSLDQDMAECILEYL